MKAQTSDPVNTHGLQRQSAFFSNGKEQSAFGSGGKEKVPPFFRPAFIQAKLKMGTPGDPYEQEADAMAEQVVKQPARASAPVSVQRKCAKCKEEEKIQKKENGEEEMQETATATKDSTLEEEMIQAKSNGSQPGDVSSLQAKLNSGKGSGIALPEDTRTEMESGFGKDFSQVKIHTDSNAIQMSEDINAKAFTHQSDIYFGSGQYNPSSTEGKKLIAHELTHTIQQGAVSESTQLVQRTEADTLRLCPIYWRYVMPILVNTYNCAGLAFRDYTYNGNVANVLAMLTSRGTQTNNCAEGHVKFWLWTYDLHAEYNGVVSYVGPDFHIVAGVAGPGGTDPTDVYSKNGQRPVYGPATGPSFRPPAREQDRENNPGEALRFLNGIPIYKLRQNMVERIFCLPCPT
jgi:uncharacterized protein with PIN domain